MGISIGKYEYIPLPSPNAICVLKFTASAYNMESMTFDVDVQTNGLSDDTYIPFIALLYFHL
jgi:hypothetical protein